MVDGRNYSLADYEKIFNSLLRPGLTPEIGNGEAVERQEDESQKDHDPDGEGVIDDREG